MSRCRVQWRNCFCICCSQVLLHNRGFNITAGDNDFCFPSGLKKIEETHVSSTDGTAKRGFCQTLDTWALGTQIFPLHLFPQSNTYFLSNASRLDHAFSALPAVPACLSAGLHCWAHPKPFWRKSPSMLSFALLLFSQIGSLIWFIAQAHKDLLSHPRCNTHRGDDKQRGRKAVTGLGTSFVRDNFNYLLFFSYPFFFSFLAPAVRGYNMIISPKRLKLTRF